MEGADLGMKNINDAFNATSIRTLKFWFTWNLFSSNVTLDLKNSTSFYFNDVIFKRKSVFLTIFFFKNLR